MRQLKATVLFGSLLAALGCTDVASEDELGTGDGDDDSVPGNPDDPLVDEACTKMDIVFVIDDSGSMSEEQANLVANFGSFANLIENYKTKDGSLLDYRIAITTAGRDVSYKLLAPDPLGEIPFSEPGMNGEFVQDCGMTRRWIERGDPDVAGTFSCAADVGTAGPGAEMPLLGLEWALGRRTQDGTNAGFLRDDALLGVVMLSDQDDCSREDDGFVIDGQKDSCFDPADPNIIPLDFYIDFLDGLKQGRGRWASAVMAGPGPGPCDSSFGTAAEATRLKDFVSRTGNNGQFSSICDGDLTLALEQALDTFEGACNTFPPIE